MLVFIKYLFLKIISSFGAKTLLLAFLLLTALISSYYWGPNNEYEETIEDIYKNETGKTIEIDEWYKIWTKH